MKRILLLGNNGMPGSMVLTYINTINNIYVVSTYNRISFSELTGKKTNELHFNPDKGSRIDDLLSRVNPDLIINNIGVIKPYCNSDNSVDVTNAIRINSLFPHQLAESAGRLLPGSKIVQIATDCVFDGKRGEYKEDDSHNPTDVYGMTKSLGEVTNKNFLNIRCSIIGPELSNKLSLMEWFLSSHDNFTVNGYTDHLWNGVTTLQFARFCAGFADDNIWDQTKYLGNTIHLIMNQDVSKYELLLIFNRVFGRRILVSDTRSEESVDRRLRSGLVNMGQISMEKAIIELKEFMDENDYYGKQVKY